MTVKAGALFGRFAGRLRRPFIPPEWSERNEDDSTAGRGGDSQWLLGDIANPGRTERACRGRDSSQAGSLQGEKRVLFAGVGDAGVKSAGGEAELGGKASEGPRGVRGWFKRCRREVQKGRVT